MKALTLSLPLRLAARAALLTLLVALSLPSTLPAQEFETQLDEVRQLIESGSHRTALEDLKFIAQQVQDLRVAAVAPFFPEPPQGWSAGEPVRSSGRDDPWSMRLEVRRLYLPDDSEGRVEFVFDFFSPLLATITMSLNPVYIAGDPLTRLVVRRNAQGRLSFNPDTGEGDLLLIVDRRILLSVIGRGIGEVSLLRDFAALVDLESLAAAAP